VIRSSRQLDPFSSDQLPDRDQNRAAGQTHRIRLAVEEGDHAVVEEIGCRDRRLAIIELGASNLGVGVDERLLRYSSLTSMN
jgi:hypothetical protein